MTSRQRDLIQFIGSHAESKGFPPTIREIASALSVSPSTVAEQFAGIERLGAIRRTPNVSRGIKIL
jgi:repressor LexA